MTNAFRILVGLLLLGNVFGAYGLIFDRAAIAEKFPKLTNSAFNILSILPLLNIIGLVGLLFWQKWAAIAVMICALLVILADIYFEITYHLFVAIPSAVLLFLFIYTLWAEFN